MLQSFIKSVGLAPLDAYVEPRISIGNAVYDRELSTGNFTVHMDAQTRALIIKNNKGRVIWKSLHNIPFLLSSIGDDEITTEPYNDALYKIVEHDEHITRLQTITRIETSDNQVRIYGGLGTKIAPATHLNYEFILEELSPTQLHFTARIVSRDTPMANYQRLMLVYESHKDEEFYGFGEQYTYGSLKGHKVPILIRERGHGRGGPQTSSFFNSAVNFAESYFGGDDSYCSSTLSIPQYITSDRRCLFLESSEYTSFNLTDPDRVTVRIDASEMAGRIVDGESMLDLITEYTSYCGRMAPLPAWINEGVVAGIQGGSDKVRQIVKQLKQHDTPLAAVWIPDWCGQRVQSLTPNVALKRLWWNWEPDANAYPDWNALVKELTNDDNVRVLTYINPLLTTTQKPNTRRDLYQEAASKQYLVRASNQQPYIVNSGGLEAGLLDLTNPEAREWFKSVLKEQVWVTGISGMMVDSGEELPYDARKIILKENKPPSTYHNLYAEMWAKLNQEVMEEQSLNDAACFYRAGFTRSPQYMSLLWTGDQNVSWDQTDGLKGAVAAMLSGGFSGFTLTHSDIGGYNTIEGQLRGASMTRSRELLYRWMELAVFTAMFRTHEGILPERNAQFYDNVDTYTHFAHMAKLYVALAPYRKKLMQEAHEKGWPMMRHLVLYYPHDATVKKLSYTQFLFGSDLLVAPTLSPSASFVKVYFPHDSRDVSWRHVWSGKYFEADGSYKTVDTPLGQPAMFIKEPRQDNGLLNNVVDFANTYCDYVANVK
ncbi:hypothetical protein K492DRAFT_229502 [Lichtheimia hyalospora FSU 10163]|nr:hypothetical protein K492DRAFT_229502 [Lichtheimia hyalospora FSU 10163]